MQFPDSENAQRNLEIAQIVQNMRIQALIVMHNTVCLVSFPVPRLAFRCLQCSISNEKLGVGLGTRLSCPAVVKSQLHYM